MAHDNGLRLAFKKLIQHLPQISAETFDSIIGGFEADGSECKTFQAAVGSTSPQAFWGVVQALDGWSSRVNSAAASDELWTSIENSVVEGSPFRSLLACLHSAQGAKHLPSGLSGGSLSIQDLDRSAAAAAIYLALQRFPGTRSRGMSNSLTFYQVLGVVACLAVAPPHRRAPTTEDANDGDSSSEDEMSDDDAEVQTKTKSSSRPRRAALARAGTKASSKAGPECVVSELAKSAGFLPLCPGGDTEPLSRTIDVLVACLSSATTSYQTLANTAGEALLSVHLKTKELCPALATSLLLKGLMPLLLCEKLQHSSSASFAGCPPPAAGAASRGRGLARSAALKVVNGLLDIAATEPPVPPTPLSSSSSSSSSSSKAAATPMVLATGEQGGEEEGDGSDDFVGASNKAVPLATSMLTLIQHLCLRGPDKAETRGAVVEAVELILRRLPSAERTHFAAFASLFSRSAKVNHRVFAVDLIAEILKTDWIWSSTELAIASPAAAPATPLPSSGSSQGTATRLLSMLIARAADRAPTVRSRALGALSALSGAALSLQEATQATLQADSSEEAEPTEAMRLCPPLCRALLRRHFVAEAPGTPDRRSPSAGSPTAVTPATSSAMGMARSIDIRALLKRRLGDERALVRRAAAQAVAALAALHLAQRQAGSGANEKELDENEERLALGWGEEVTALVSLCADVSVATRKAAAAALSQLRQSLPRSSTLRSAWCGAVLPLAHDSEVTVAARCGEFLKDALLEPVAEWGDAWTQSAKRGKKGGAPQPAMTDPRHVWRLLSTAHSPEAQKCLQAALWPVALRAPSGSVTDSSSFAGGPALHAKVLTALRSAALLGCGRAPNGDSLDTEEGIEGSEMLSSSVRNSVRQGAWVLFEAVLCPSIHSGSTTHAPAPLTAATVPVDPTFVIACWHDLWAEIDACEIQEQEEAASAAGSMLGASESSGREALEQDAQRMLRVVAFLAPAIAADAATALASELISLLQALHATPTTAASMLKALISLCSTKAPTVEAAAAISKGCASALLAVSQETLETFAFSAEAGGGTMVDTGEAQPSLPHVERALHMVGEVALLGFSPDENGLGSDGRPVLDLRVDPSLIALVRVLLATHLPPAQQASSLSAEDETPEQGEGAVIPESVRAFAFVALGKVCLVDQRLAKECVTLLVREIDHCPSDDGGSGGTYHQGSPAVQSNALLVLGDLCVRYTALVERHLPALARCLQSPHALIRRHALLLLSQLLLQDYLKWRGLLLHRFLLCTIDTDAEVSTLARFLVTGPLTQKQPTLLSYACVDLLFILNGYEEHPKYQAALLHGSEGSGAMVNFAGCEDAATLSEETRRSRRHELLRFVCGALSDEQRIEATARVAHEVLSPAAQGLLPCDPAAATDSSMLSPNNGRARTLRAAAEADGVNRDFGVQQHKLGFSVLRDALFVLSCPEIKVGRGIGSSDVTEEEMLTAAANGHATAAAAAGLEAAKERLLSKMSRKQLMEHVVPIVLGLKRALEERHSPLLRDLMAFLAELAKCYRSEVKAVLSVLDPVLCKELEYDLKMFEKQQRQQQQQSVEDMQRKAAKPPATGGDTSALVSPRRTVVGFTSPTQRKQQNPPSLSAMKSKVKSGIKSASRESVPTPKLRLANTPRSERESRTPMAAVSAALSANRARGAGGGGGEGTEDNGMISTEGLAGYDDDGANKDQGVSPVLFRMKQNSAQGPSPSDAMSTGDENDVAFRPRSSSASAMLPPPPPGLKKAPPAGPTSPVPSSSSSSARAPMHRTPRDSKKKKKVVINRI